MSSVEARRARRQRRILAASEDRLKLLTQGQQEEEPELQSVAEQVPFLRQEEPPALNEVVRRREEPVEKEFVPAGAANDPVLAANDPILDESSPLLQLIQGDPGENTSPKPKSDFDSILWLILGVISRFFLLMMPNISVITGFVAVWLAREVYKGGQVDQAKEGMAFYVEFGLKMAGMAPKKVEILSFLAKLTSSFAKSLTLFMFSFILAHQMHNKLL